MLVVSHDGLRMCSWTTIRNESLSCFLLVVKSGHCIYFHVCVVDCIAWAALSLICLMSITLCILQSCLVCCKTVLFVHVRSCETLACVFADVLQPKHSQKLQAQHWWKHPADFFTGLLGRCQCLGWTAERVIELTPQGIAQLANAYSKVSKFWFLVAFSAFIFFPYRSPKPRARVL